MSGDRILRVLTVWLTLGLVLIMATLASGDIPRRINYQGRVTDGLTEEPLPGDHTMVFRIYDAGVDGTLLWSEEQVVTADSAGVLSAILGSDTAIEVSFEGPCWLEVEVDGETLLPRRELVSVPFAFRALNCDSLGGFDSGAFSLTDHSHDEIYVNEGEDSSVTVEMLLPDIVSSIDGVTNDGGDIDLVAGSNITITPDDANNRITIEATGGAGGDITGVYADDGLSGGATEGDAHLSVRTGTGLEVSGDAVGMTSGYSTGSTYDSRFVNESQASSVTAAMVVPDLVSSVDGVTNDGGNIDLVAGSNITITPDDGNNKITIASTAAGDGHSLDAADGSPANAVYVDNAGEVGIGTTTPGYKLDVRGSLKVSPSGAEHGLVVSDNGAFAGYVGISTDDPRSPLDTPGPVKIGTPPGAITLGDDVGLFIISDDNTSSSIPLAVRDQDFHGLLTVKGDGGVACGVNMPLTRFHVCDVDIDLTEAALHADVAVVEDGDAILGLYSSGSGAAGSAVTFGEITNGDLVDKWAIVRETTGTGDGGLRITYGTSNDQFVNGLVMYLDDTRRVGIGTRSVGTYELYVAGDAYATGGWTPSDLRYKQEIEEIESALDKVLALRGVLFRWRTEEYEDKNFPEGRHYGVIAQEAEEVLPEIVKEGPDGEKAIAYTEMIPVLIESIKDLKAENEVLRERLASLEAAVGVRTETERR